MARYDGIAAWYDDYVSTDAAPFTQAVRDALARALGSGSGTCLDVGCGTGVLVGTVEALGWSVVGLDLSVDQLCVARERVGDRVRLVHGDAADLPFESESFDAAYATLVHTDVDDIGRVFAEVARILRPGGRFAYVGTHPCFVGPFAERRPDDSLLLHPRYWETGRHYAGPGIGAGIRGRVGVRHVPLADLVNAALGAGLALFAVEEVGDGLPTLIVLRAKKPATA